MAQNKLSIIISENSDSETKCRGVLEFVKRINQKLEDESSLNIYHQLLTAIFGTQSWMDQAAYNPNLRALLLELLAPYPNGPLLHAFCSLPTLSSVALPLNDLPVCFLNVATL